MGLRLDGRKPDSLRPLRIEVGYLAYAEGSALITLGKTVVLCAVSVEDRQPPFLRGTSQGWVTAEYAMLPRSTQRRSMRESVIGRSEIRKRMKTLYHRHLGDHQDLSEGFQALQKAVKEDFEVDLVVRRREVRREAPRRHPLSARVVLDKTETRG